MSAEPGLKRLFRPDLFVAVEAPCNNRQKRRKMAYITFSERIIGRFSQNLSELCVIAHIF